jgi:WD40 repeat protein
MNRKLNNLNFIGRQDALIHNILSFLPLINLKKLYSVSRKWNMISDRVYDQMPFQGTCFKVLRYYNSCVSSLVVLGDGKTLCSGSSDNTIRVWNVEKGTCIKVLKGHTCLVTSLVVLEDGKTLCSGSRDEMIRVWDIEKGTCMKVLEGYGGCAESLVVLGDGKTLCSESKDGDIIRVWR